MHSKLPRLIVAAAIAAGPLLQMPSSAGATPDPVCYTVLVTGPDGEPRWVTICVPPEFT